VDTLMVLKYRIIDQSATPAQRLAAFRAYYFDAVKFINANYPRLGLKPFKPPPDVDKRLAEAANDLATQAKLSQSNALLTVTSDQNLFANDEIHFQINVTPDVRWYNKGQPIAQLTIPGKSGANMNLAVSQLLNLVTVNARSLGIPKFLADDVQPLQLIPALSQMQQMVTKPGTFYLTAFAAEDFYPHVGLIPVVVVLTPQPRQ
jgi:hypothetical protein